MLFKVYGLMFKVLGLDLIDNLPMAWVGSP
jgi:hypothetical protein